MLSALHCTCSSLDLDYFLILNRERHQHLLPLDESDYLLVVAAYYAPAVVMGEQVGYSALIAVDCNLDLELHLGEVLVEQGPLLVGGDDDRSDIPELLAIVNDTRIATVGDPKALKLFL
jgi:hypothetical protein